MQKIKLISQIFFELSESPESRNLIARKHLDKVEQGWLYLNRTKQKYYIILLTVRLSSHVWDIADYSLLFKTLEPKLHTLGDTGAQKSCNLMCQKDFWI